MVVFDLNTTRHVVESGVNSVNSAAAAFQRDASVTVKSVKRLSSHAWPFYVKNSVPPEHTGGMHDSPSNHRLTG